MTFHKIPRKVHQERAQRIEARFSPTWTGDPPSPTATVLPNDPAPPPPASRPPPPPAPAPAPAPTTPAGPVAPPVRPTTGPVLPVTTPPTAITPLVPATTPTLSTPVVPTTTSIPSVVRTTPTIVDTPSSKLITSIPTPTTFRSLPSAAVTLLTTSSPSPTATAAPSSSGMSTGGIVGIAAGSIAGVALVGALVVWIFKRWFNSRDEHDDVNGGSGGFSRHSWMRNSVALADDVPSPMVRGGMGGMGGPSESPRPPTMIERKQTQNYANLPPSRQQYGQGNMGMGYSDYQDSPYGAPPPMPGYNHGQQPGYQQPGYNPGQHYGAGSPHTAQGFFSPISPPPPSPGMVSFDETMPPMQHATGVPAYFSRHDSNMSVAQPDSAALPDMPNPHAPNPDGYATLDRSSVTPYQAQQYAEISRQLDVVQPLPTVSETEPAPPAPQAHQEHNSPFADPAYPDLTAAPLPDLAIPAAAHPRVGSTPPTLPPMRVMSPVDQANGKASFAQLANAFPATPAVPSPVAGSPRSPVFPPASPVVGAHKSPVVTVPDTHADRETPVQFGFNQPASSPAPAPAKGAAAHAPPASRPETMYDEEDAYGGI